MSQLCPSCGQTSSCCQHLVYRALGQLAGHMARQSAACYDWHRGLLRGLRLERVPLRRLRRGRPPPKVRGAQSSVAWGREWFREQRPVAAPSSPHRTFGGWQPGTSATTTRTRFSVSWHPHAQGRPGPRVSLPGGRGRTRAKAHCWAAGSAGATPARIAGNGGVNATHSQPLLGRRHRR